MFRNLADILRRASEAARRALRDLKLGPDYVPSYEPAIVRRAGPRPFQRNRIRFRGLAAARAKKIEFQRSDRPRTAFNPAIARQYRSPVLVSVLAKRRAALPTLSVLQRYVPQYKSGYEMLKSILLASPVPQSSRTASAVDFDLTARICIPENKGLDAELLSAVEQRVDAQISHLKSILADIKRVGQIGELPVSVMNNGASIRVHFPNTDCEHTERLLSDAQVRFGRVVEEVSHFESVPETAESFLWEDAHTSPGLSDETTVSLLSVPTVSATSLSFDDVLSD